MGCEFFSCESCNECYCDEVSCVECGENSGLCDGCVKHDDNCILWRDIYTTKYKDERFYRHTNFLYMCDSCIDNWECESPTDLTFGKCRGEYIEEAFGDKTEICNKLKQLKDNSTERKLFKIDNEIEKNRIALVGLFLKREKYLLDEEEKQINTYKMKFLLNEFNIKKGINLLSNL